MLDMLTRHRSKSPGFTNAVDPNPSAPKAAQLCLAGVPHMINNAYGIQSAILCRSITTAWRKGRVDAVVQSTDKNFMVPVGGAIVAAPASNSAAVAAINQLYPGRACMAPLLDLLMTLLHWGAQVCPPCMLCTGLGPVSVNYQVLRCETVPCTCVLRHSLHTYMPGGTVAVQGGHAACL